MKHLTEEEVRLAYVAAGSLNYGAYAAFRAGMLAGYLLAQKGAK